MLYVFALVDARPSGRLGKGLSNPVAVHPVRGAFAVVERRADVPPVEFGSLRAHEAVIDRLARAVPAILPVRFGTLLDATDLDAAVDERSDDLGEAFDLVRGRVQFTWRAATRSRKIPAAPARTAARSGADYLRRAAAAAHPAAPPSFRRVRALSALTVGERYTSATALLPGALYHLVDRRREDAYVEAAADVRASAPGLKWSGPFAPYAFAPEFL